MSVLAFLTYPAFGRRNFRPVGRCRIHLMSYTAQIVSLSAAKDYMNKEYSDEIEQANAGSGSNHATGSLSSDIGNHAKMKAQYEFFNTQLGLKNSTGQKGTKNRARPKGVSSPAEPSTHLEEVNDDVEVEAKRVDASPAHYDLFDQLLRSTGGTGRKPIKGSKPFILDAKRHRHSRTTNRNSVSQDRRSQDQSEGNQIGDVRVKPLGNEKVEGRFGEANSSSYEFMKEEFGEGFHGQEPVPRNANNEKGDIAPSVSLHDRPRRCTQSASSSRTAEVPVGFNYKTSDPEERISDSTSKSSETKASTAASYDFMREEFGAGFHDVGENIAEGDVNKPRSAGNAPPLLQDRPKRDPDKYTVYKDHTASSAVSVEPINSTPTGPPPKLNAPPRRPLLREGQNEVTSTQEPSAPSLIGIQDRSGLPFRRSVESSLQYNKSSELSPPPNQSSRNAVKGTGGQEKVSKDAEGKLVDSKHMSADKHDTRCSRPSVLSSGEDVSTASEGVVSDSRVAEKIPLRARPTLAMRGEDSKVQAKRIFEGSQRFYRRGKQGQTNEVAFVLKNPKLVSAGAKSRV
eukprot:TRINITY_DN79_c0_g1_i1.p1 TRINITY_DN79_c0_g1~~TRINITY_DN79_c0_g1_i1.p1  ORF type:complete len:570 (-),score=63.82 TRINITY_DN79_c0_g1_i1:814-2523(-)